MKKNDRFQQLLPVAHIIIASFGVATCLFPEWFPFLPGSNSHSAQILVVFLLLGILLMVARKPNLTFLYFGAVLAMSFHLKRSLQQNGMEYWRTFPGQDVTQAPSWSPRFRLVHFQLNRSPEVGELLRSIRRNNPDIVSLQLANAMKDRALFDSLRNTYPHSRHLRAGDGTESAVLTRYRIGFHDTLYVDGLPTFRNCFKLDGHDLCLSVVHMVREADSTTHFRQQEKLEALGKKISLLNIPQVVLGNFHFAAWSDELGKFLRITGLRSTRDGFLQDGFSLDTPTRHILFSDRLRCDNFQVVTSGIQDEPTALLGQFSFTKNLGHANKPPK
ncbi:MAG: hypothetical protein RLY31_1882 [Bacteroidota bacterium]|jgi:endonuclease/exonuclease/phosphatase (EEP) superfamily protein YafD